MGVFFIHLVSDTIFAMLFLPKPPADHWCFTDHSLKKHCNTEYLAAVLGHDLCAMYIHYSGCHLLSLFSCSDRKISTLQSEVYLLTIQKNLRMPLIGSDTFSIPSKQILAQML
jgi:hypothetical protein